MLWFTLTTSVILGSKPNTHLGLMSSLMSELIDQMTYEVSPALGVLELFQIMFEGREGREMLFWVEKPKFAATDLGELGAHSARAESSAAYLNALVNRKQTKPIFLGAGRKVCSLCKGLLP